MPEGARRLHGDRQQPGIITEVLGPHRDEFDVVFDNTAYHVEDLEPMVELFAGRVQHFAFTSSVAVYRRTFVQPVLETFRTHDPRDTGAGEGLRRGQGAVRAVPRRPVPGARVPVHGVPGRPQHRAPQPAADPRADLLRAPHPGPARSSSRARASRSSTSSTWPTWHRSWRRSSATTPPSGQIYNVSGTEFTSILGCVRLMATAAGVEPNIVHVPIELARTLRGPLMHWHEGLNGGTVYGIDKALRDLDWRRRSGWSRATRTPTTGGPARAATATSTTSASTTRCWPCSAASTRRRARARWRRRGRRPARRASSPRAGRAPARAGVTTAPASTR